MADTKETQSSLTKSSIKGEASQITSSVNYDPYLWPANVKDARIHETANSLGQQDTSSKNQIVCECCNKSANKTQHDWKKVNVGEAVGKEYGSAVPLLFSLAKYYAICIIGIFCVNGIYSIYQYRRLCNLHPDSCIKMLGFLPIMGDDQVLEYLSPSESFVFRWLNFATYLTILASQILVDLFIDMKQKKLSKQEGNLQRTVIIGGIQKGIKESELKTLLTDLFGGKLDIKEIFFPEDYSDFYEVFEKRTKLYFASKKQTSNKNEKQQKKFEKLKESTAKLSLELHEIFNSHLECKGKAFVTLGSFEEAAKLKKLYPNNFFSKGNLLLSKILNKPSQKSSFMIEWAPSLSEIKWENVGVREIEKMKILTVTSFFAISAAVASGVCLTFLQNHISGSYILIFNIVVMGFYNFFLETLALKKKGKTNTSKSFFLMSMQGFFVLIYFILLPLLYYGFQHTETTGARTYSLFVMFIANSAFQFIGIGLNGKYKAHKSFSLKLDKNPEEVASQYCQKDLNSKIQKPEFELEQRMIGIMQLWTYSTLHAFICPYTQLISFFFIVIIYKIAKKMLFTQYSLYSFKTLNLQRRFLKFYSFGFQLAVLFMFLIANQTRQQKVIASIAFAIFYIGYAIYRSKTTAVEGDSGQQSDKQSNGESYHQAYKQFVQSFYQPTLEKGIEELIAVPNPFLRDILEMKQKTK